MYRVETKHRTELAMVEGRLCHDFGLSSVDGHPNEDLVAAIIEALALRPGSIGGIDVIVHSRTDIVLKRGEYFGSAEPGSRDIVFRTTQVGFWELFQLQLDGYVIPASEDRLLRIPLGSLVDPQVVARVPERTEILRSAFSVSDQDTTWFEENAVSFFAVRSGPVSPQNSVVRVKEKYLSTKIEAHGTVFDEAGFYNNSHFIMRKAASFDDLAFSSSSVLLKSSVSKACRYIDGIYCLPFDGNSSNYYHFLIDGIVHYHILDRLGFRAPPIMFIGRDGLRAWQKELLDLAGISAMLLIDGSREEIVKVSDLHWLQNTGVHQLPCEELIRVRNILRSASGTSNAIARRRLYIKRKPGARAIINSEEVETYVTSKGFECVDLEGLPVLRQIVLFSEAEIVVGAHGAGLANILFCNPGAKLVDIIPGTGEVRNFFWILSEKIGVVYRFLRSSASNYESAMHVDINLLDAVVRMET